MMTTTRDKPATYDLVDSVGRVWAEGLTSRTAAFKRAKELSRANGGISITVKMR